MKIKLKDLTKEQYENRKCVKCNYCPMRYAICNSINEECWIYNKDLFSDKFLNQELEIEETQTLEEYVYKELDKKYK